jgi:diguanylate cyclase (GGDEF)-like protein
VLEAVGACLLGGVRRTDVVGRVGGDEFAVLLPGIDFEGARALFDKLHRRLGNEMRANGWPVGFSVGVAVFAEPPRGVDEALAAADRLMYEVKNATRNDVRYLLIGGGPPVSPGPGAPRPPETP